MDGRELRKQNLRMGYLAQPDFGPEHVKSRLAFLKAVRIGLRVENLGFGECLRCRV